AGVVVGSADGTESQGYDRKTLGLPGKQDELVRRVAAANPKTIVVVNSGTPVLMPWATDVAAILQVWFPGQAFGEALADGWTGAAEPGGRLPVSIRKPEVGSPGRGTRPAPGTRGEPLGLLARCANVAAEPGAQVTARLSVPSRAFARYDEGLGRWDAEPGAYTIRAGRSSRDLRVSVEVVMR